MNHKKLYPIWLAYYLVFIMPLASCATVQEAAPTSIPPTLPIPPATVTLSPTEIALQMILLNPAPRGYMSMAYDVESDQVIMFGGQTGDYRDPASYSDETWSYDVSAEEWTQMKPSSSPSKRSAADMVYDTESDRAILFGGADQISWDFNDTWAYDYNSNIWMEMAKGPAKHLGSRLAYDSESDRIILFGGLDIDKWLLYNDTWAYDFNSNTWTELKPNIAPPGRNYQAMTYDSRSDRVIVWGGTDLNGIPLDNSVWSYDFNTNTWQELKSTGIVPVGRDYPVMVHDIDSDQVILFGGSLGSDETWSYDYNTETWTKMEPKKIPGKRSRHEMVYCASTGQVLLFGGQIGGQEFEYTWETWTYDFNTNIWTNVTSHP